MPDTASDHACGSGPPPAGPLAGFVLVSTAINLPGPWAAARCAEMGAEVTTVLPPAGDPLERFQPGWFGELHADQRRVTIDLTEAAGVQDLHALLDGADVLITASRPSALARWGLDGDDLPRRHPRLCHIAIVGHPAPDADRPGHDLTYQATAGLVDPPRLPATLVADLAGAERAVREVLAALLHRERTGVTTVRQVALAEAARTMAEPLARGLTRPGGPLGGGRAAYGLYRAREGWVALAAIEGHFARTVRELLGVDGSAAAFARVFSTRTADDWEAWAAAHDLPLVAVRSASDPVTRRRDRSPS